MKGRNTLYVVGITLVATLGGLLFGYDTAVISGAEKSIQAYLITGLGLSSWAHGGNHFQRPDRLYYRWNDIRNWCR